MTNEQIERLGVRRLEIVFDCGCFAETLKNAELGPHRAVEVSQRQAEDLQLMQSARSERGFLILEAPGRNPKARNTNTHALGLFSLSVWQTGISAKPPSATEKQTLHKAGLGVKKIKLQLDDDETSVYGKLISGEKDDAGDVKGFPQLCKAGGFEMLHCLPNCRDVTPLKSSWAARELRCNLGGQSKIYLRPIQRNLSTESLTPQNSCVVKEKCMSCKKEFPMSELRTHTFYMCTAGFNSDEDSEGEKIKESYTLESKVDAIAVDDSLQLESTQAEGEKDFTPAVSSQPTAENEQDPIDAVISYCEANNIQNPVEILHCMQKYIVTGRALELQSDSETLVGETNYINVDRMNLLETTFEEVGALENLCITLEVSFYGKVGLFYEQFLLHFLMSKA